MTKKLRRVKFLIAGGYIVGRDELSGLKFLGFVKHQIGSFQLVRLLNICQQQQQQQERFVQCYIYS